MWVTNHFRIFFIFFAELETNLLLSGSKNKPDMHFLTIFKKCPNIICWVGHSFKPHYTCIYSFKFIPKCAKLIITTYYMVDSFWKNFFNLHVSSKLDCRFLSFPYYISTERDKPYDIWKKLVSLELRRKGGKGSNSGFSRIWAWILGPISDRTGSNFGFWRSCQIWPNKLQEGFIDLLRYYTGF